MNKKIKILPILIVCALLMFAVKVGTLLKRDFDVESKKPSSDMDVTILDNIKGPNDTFSKAEVEILQDLAARRELLDAKEKELEKRSFQINVAAEEIDRKILQMKEYEKRLSELVNKYNAQEKEKVSTLIKVYSAMKPKDAAQIFDTLNLDILVLLFSSMKPSTSSAILAQMEPKIAKEVTVRLAGNGAFED